MRRRGVIAAVALVGVVVLGLGAALLALRHRRVATVRGSTTVEYVPSAAPPAPARSRTPSASGLAWPTYGYDAERVRFDPAVHLRPPFRRVWTFHGRALLEFPPVVAYGRVYLANVDGVMFGLDARTGRVEWRYRSGMCGWASPAVADHLVFVTFIGSAECGSHAAGGEVVAFDATTGRMRWRRRLGPTESSPLVARGLVLVGDWDGRVWALEARTVRVRWTSELAGAIKGSLATGGGRLYIGTYGGEVACLDARSGRTLWTSGGHGPFYSSPAVAYGRVYIGSLNGGVYAFGAATGHLLWEEPTSGYVYASPAVWNGRILVGSYDHAFYAFDAGTGDVRWRFAADGPISGAATVIDGLVYFSTFARHTYALDAASGSLVATWPDGEYSPVVADADRLYLVGLGRMYALAERTPR